MLSGELSGVEVKSYRAIASLRDKANSYWSIEGSPTDDQSVLWMIEPLDASALEITLPESLIYNGNPMTPDVKVSYNGTALVQDSDYELTFKDNDKIGTAKAIIRGINNYCGIEERPFDVVKCTQHVFDAWTIMKSPTCSEQGAEETHCQICGDRFERPIAALDHVPGEWTTVKSPTCAQKGIEESNCTLCGERVERTLEDLGHVPGEWQVVRVPTDSQDGAEEQHCTRCGAFLDGKVIKRLGSDAAATPMPDTGGKQNFAPAAVGSKITAGSGSTAAVYKVVSASTAAPQVEYTLSKASTSATSITVPSSIQSGGVTYQVVSVASKAFAGYSKLASVTIGDNVETVSNDAFANSKALTKVVVGKKVTTIGKRAFYKCAKLKTVKFKGTAVKKIGMNAFNGCKKLTNFTLKSKKITKPSVKGSLKGSSLKYIKTAGSLKSKYQTFFAKANSGLSISIK